MKKKTNLLKQTGILSLFMCAILISSTSLRAADITTGLVARYSFDAISGKTVTDDSGNDNSGILVGTPTVNTSGHSGSAMTFPTANDYMTLPTEIAKSLTDFTISSWVYLNKLNSWSRIFDFGTGTSYFMFITPNSNTNTVRFSIKNNNSGEDVNGTAPLPTGRWVHVAVTFAWDASTSKGTGKLYVDGKLAGINSALSCNPSMLPSTTQNYIAKSQYTADPALNGSIDEFRIYNRTLTDMDILSLSGTPDALIDAYSNLTANSLKSDGDLTNVTSDLTLPTTSEADVSIAWKSTLPATVSATGAVVQPEKFDATVTLTATLTQITNSVTHTLSKDFLVTVKARNANSERLAQWNFGTPNIFISNDSVKVKDATESGFIGTILNDARIRTIGGPINGETHVLDLGNGTGYFDMGTEIGKVIYSLNDYTMCAFFRIDNAYTALNNNGNFIWNFSNSANAPVDMNGYIIGNLKAQAHAATPTYWNNENNVSLNTNAPKGGWHHIAFTQSGTIGTLYIDGVQVTQNTSFNYIPATVLPRTGFTGTPYNWLGRSCYPGDAYLRQTLLYDFQLLSVPLSANDFKTSIAVSDSIEKLNKAYAENSDLVFPELTTESENLSLGDLNMLTNNIALPTKGSIDPAIIVNWTSSHPAIINPTGTISRPDYFDAHVTLTAILMKNGQAMTKSFSATVKSEAVNHHEKPRVIAVTDGEADDRASMVRFLLSTNEFDVEGIINSSSQFHWEGGSGWNAFHPVTWVKDYLDLYSKVYDNLLLHNKEYPSPAHLLSKWKVGNISGIGEDKIRTEGAKWIAQVLLDNSDPRPVWIQAWGGCNTISRALRIIQEDYPDRMEEVAEKTRLFLIWEQDETYQTYIRPNWEKFDIPTIISDQFDCMAYIWPKVLPADVQRYFEANWMTNNILKDRGALCDVYENNKGAFNAEGDTPSFLHCIPNGLRSMESPENGGWGGRYIKVRNNVWMDPLPSPSYEHVKGQWGFSNSWSKKMENYTTPDLVEIRTNYFKPIWRWLKDVQCDFAAKADWCVKDYASANHHPIVCLKNTPLDIKAKAGSEVVLDASESIDPDGNTLYFKWWNYSEAGSYAGKIIAESPTAKTTITIPEDALPGQTFHMICEVSDSGIPSLTRYQRVIITVNENEGTHIENTSVFPYSIVSVNGGIKINGLSNNEKVSVVDISGRTMEVGNPEYIHLQSGVYTVNINNYSRKVVVM